jgi:hypothetical protein
MRVPYARLPLGAAPGDRCKEGTTQPVTAEEPGHDNDVITLTGRTICKLRLMQAAVVSVCCFRGFLATMNCALCCEGEGLCIAASTCIANHQRRRILVLCLTFERCLDVWLSAIWCTYARQEGPIASTEVRSNETVAVEKFPSSAVNPGMH